MCWCILTHGNNQEGPSQTICMFVKHEIPFDSTVGNFSCILVLFDCLKVPTTLTIRDFSPLLPAVGWRCNMDGHRGSGTLADGCSRDLAARWGGCWGVGVETPEM